MKEPLSDVGRLSFTLGLTAVGILITVFLVTISNSMLKNSQKQLTRGDSIARQEVYNTLNAYLNDSSKSTTQNALVIIDCANYIGNVYIQGRTEEGLTNTANYLTTNSSVEDFVNAQILRKDTDRKYKKHNFMIKQIDTNVDGVRFDVWFCGDEATFVRP